MSPPLRTRPSPYPPPSAFPSLHRQPRRPPKTSPRIPTRPPAQVRPSWTSPRTPPPKAQHLRPPGVRPRAPVAVPGRGALPSRPPPSLPAPKTGTPRPLTAGRTTRSAARATIASSARPNAAGPCRAQSVLGRASFVCMTPGTREVDRQPRRHRGIMLLPSRRRCRSRRLRPWPSHPRCHHHGQRRLALPPAPLPSWAWPRLKAKSLIQPQESRSSTAPGSDSRGTMRQYSPLTRLTTLPRSRGNNSP
jgi:hypothetical protein